VGRAAGRKEEAVLTAEQVAQYRRDGYVVSPGLLSRDEVDALLADVESICAGNTLARHDKTRVEMEPNQGPDGTRVRRVYEPCTHYPRFRGLSESAKLLDCVEQLLGPNLTFHYSKINMKPPAIGSVVEWHQDLSYYPLTNHDSVSILFYLDDADRGNGCLQVIPGRHRGPLLDHTRDGIFQGRVTEPVDEREAVALEGRAGAVIFMDAMTPHASLTNTSDRPRRTLILSYRAADAYPIYCGEMTTSSEGHARLVRGTHPTTARFDMPAAFPIPHYPRKTASLYELQELSREGKAAVPANR
jgi:phytanoyl-CoA hydroxylase